MCLILTQLVSTQLIISYVYLCYRLHVDVMACTLACQGALYLCVYTIYTLYLQMSEKQGVPEPSYLSPGAVAGIVCSVLFVVAFVVAYIGELWCCNTLYMHTYT